MPQKWSGQRGTPQEALAEAYNIDSPDQQSDALAQLSSLPSGPLKYRVLRKALAAAQQIDDKWRRLEALAYLASDRSMGVEERALQEALATLQAVILGTEDRETVLTKLTRLLPTLPTRLQTEVLTRGLEIVQHLPEHSADFSKGKALAELAPYLSELLLREALAITREIESKLERSRALTGLAPYCAQLRRDMLYSIWQKTLYPLASRTRQDLLADLRALNPITRALGGDEVMPLVFRAIKDVEQWWP